MTREILYRELPNSDAAVKARRDTKKIKEEMIWISEQAEIAGQGSEVFISGCGWMFEVINLESGALAFYRDNQLVKPNSNYFAVFYAPFSVVQLAITDVKFRWVGLGSALASAPANWMTVPLIFDLQIEDLPKNADAVIDILKTQRRFESIEVNTRPSLLSKRAKKIIDASWSDPPAIASLARSLKVSHEHLTRQFKKDFGLAPNTYLHKVRLNYAIWKLSQGEKIADVSLDVGYNDLGRFYKQFRKFMKTSPGNCKNI
jgi:AraC-like DNA-binding protein